MVLDERAKVPGRKDRSVWIGARKPRLMNWAQLARLETEEGALALLAWDILIPALVTDRVPHYRWFVRLSSRSVGLLNIDEFHLGLIIFHAIQFSLAFVCSTVPADSYGLFQQGSSKDMAHTL